eukprot:TRINITY_DN2069_c0_g1_i1.p1 TRINITY_DN2069_c0_g1~~TRINITY_DN2069_c0_g1_i1.p1  ORF type:complete len:161 (+),score=24.38 TRINITY_DN2069_c0_g1_i1:97-579(+)
MGDPILIKREFEGDMSGEYVVLLVFAIVFAGIGLLSCIIALVWQHKTAMINQDLRRRGYVEKGISISAVIDDDDSNLHIDQIAQCKTCGTPVPGLATYCFICSESQKTKTGFDFRTKFRSFRCFFASMTTTPPKETTHEEREKNKELLFAGEDLDTNVLL